MKASSKRAFSCAGRMDLRLHGASSSKGGSVSKKSRSSHGGAMARLGMEKSLAGRRSSPTGERENLGLHPERANGGEPAFDMDTDTDTDADGISSLGEAAILPSLVLIVSYRILRTL